MKNGRLNTWNTVAAAAVFFGGITASFTACEKLRNFRMDENVITQFVQDECECTSKLFYYYSGNKRFIDSRLIRDYLFVGFDLQAHDTAIVNYINQTGLFNAVDVSKIGVGDDCKRLFVNTIGQKTCLQLKELISILETSPIVIFAHFTFDFDAEFGGVKADIATYSNEFLVMLGSSDLSDLQDITIATNTQIKDYSVWSDVYVIGTDKNSQGDALQMANYFYETGKFVLSDPNFLYAKIGRK